MKMPDERLASEEILRLDNADAAVRVPYERTFRLVADAPHIIRLRQDPGELFDTADNPARLSPYSTSYLTPRIAENVRLEGLDQSAAERLTAFMTGRVRRLSLEYQDEHTIAVRGQWRDAENGAQDVRLGFLPGIVVAQLRELAAETVPLGVAATIRTLALPGPGRDAELWCDIWTLEA